MDDISVCTTSENSETMSYSSACSGDDDREEELSISLSGQLKINDENRADAVNGARSSPVDRCYIEEEEDEDEDKGGISEETLLAQMGYANSDSILNYEEEEEVEEDISEDSLLVKNEAPKHEPINIPTAAELNLVSALKGSREREGRAAEEWQVSWAPDVYDPPCTSDDHFAVSKNERHRVEHKIRSGSGRNRQKRGGVEGRAGGGGGGKGSRGGGGSEGGGGSKDKKKGEKKHKKHGHKHSDPG